MRDERSTLLDLFAAGVAAVDPASAVVEALAEDDRPAPDAILAVGKAAVGMAWGAAEVYGHRPGLVVSPEPAPVPPGLTHLVTAHPVPDERSLAAGDAALDLASSLDIDQRLLVLISGGASALLEAPLPGIGLDDLTRLTDQLLTSGAPIGEVNTVRIATSRIKGGGLQAATRAAITTLAISDVVGDDPRVIGSGPTVGPNPTTSADRVARRYADWLDLSPAVRTALGSPVIRSPHATRSDYRVIASGTTAARAIAAAATDLGLVVRTAADPVTGDATAAARDVVAAAVSGAPGLDVYHGETTLQVQGSGAGGRCQHACLVAANEIRGRRDLWFLAAGTDGRDGPTEAAGACVDGGSVDRAAAAGHTVAAHLADYDSHSWLRAAGDLIETGATGTNVGDLWLCWRQS